jgi:hypothetical protein
MVHAARPQTRSGGLHQREGAAVADSLEAMTFLGRANAWAARLYLLRQPGAPAGNTDRLEPHDRGQPCAARCGSAALIGRTINSDFYELDEIVRRMDERKAVRWTFTEAKVSYGNRTFLTAQIPPNSPGGDNNWFNDFPAAPFRIALPHDQKWVSVMPQISSITSPGRLRKCAALNGSANRIQEVQISWGDATGVDGTEAGVQIRPAL